MAREIMVFVAQRRKESTAERSLSSQWRQLEAAGDFYYRYPLFGLDSTQREPKFLYFLYVFAYALLGNGIIITKAQCALENRAQRHVTQFVFLQRRFHKAVSLATIRSSQSDQLQVAGSRRMPVELRLNSDPGFSWSH